MDVLSDVLRVVRLSGAVYFDITAHEPWVVASPDMAEVRAAIMPGAEHVMAFHIMMSGSCWVQPVDRSSPPMLVGPGDVILFPRGNSHLLGSEPGSRTEPDMSLYYRPTDRQLPFLLTDMGGAGAGARFVCGYLGCDATPFNPLLDALPPMTVVKAGSERLKLTGDLIDATLAEGEARRPGGETILAKLSEVMLLQAVRRHIDSLPDASESWLAGLRDPPVARVLALIHSQPTEDWNLGSLARQSGMSRTTLVERFTRIVGQPPIQYLGRWRMQLAARALEQTQSSIAQIAGEVGYQSEAAFNRAFKKFVGMPPGLWRRSHPPAVG